MTQKSPFLTFKPPPPNRVGQADDPYEHHLTEAAVMLAMAEWCFALGADDVSIHPDGMHLKGFDVQSWLADRGYAKIESRGRTVHGGVYGKGHCRLHVYPRPGLGDVVCEIGGQRIEIEAKGGCINTRHAGQKPRLRRHLHEAVGQLMSSETQGGRFIAAVPDHEETRRLAGRLARRCREVRIEIALVDGGGSVEIVG